MAFRDEFAAVGAAQEDVAVSAPFPAPSFREEFGLGASKGFWESLTEDPSEKLPLVGLGFTIKHALDDTQLVQEAMAGNADSAQMLGMKLRHGQRKRTAGGWAGAILSELPGTMVEFLATGGLASMAKKGGSAAARKVIGEGFDAAVDRAVSTIGRTRLGRSGLALAGAATRAAVQTALMPSTYANVLRRKMPPGMDVVLDPANARRAAIVFQGSQLEFAEALPEGLLDSYIETLSEYSGRLIPTHYLASLQGAVLRRWLKVNPSKTVEDFLERISYGAGWNGPLQEFGEERLGAAARAATGLGAWDEVWPDANQLYGELLAFSVAEGGLAAARMIGSKPLGAEEQAAAIEAAFQSWLIAARERAGEAQPEEVPEAPPEAEPQPTEEPPPVPAEEAPPPEAVEPEPAPEPVHDEPKARTLSGATSAFLAAAQAYDETFGGGQEWPATREEVQQVIDGYFSVSGSLPGSLSWLIRRFLAEAGLEPSAELQKTFQEIADAYEATKHPDLEAGTDGFTPEVAKAFGVVQGNVETGLEDPDLGSALAGMFRFAPFSDRLAEQFQELLERTYGTSESRGVHDEPEAPPADPIPTPEEEAAVAQEPAPTLVLGQASEVVLPGERTLPVTYAAIEADELLTSHDPLQGFKIRPGGDANERPYEDAVEGKELRQRVRSIAEGMRPELVLSDDPTATGGPPIITQGGVVLGGNARGMAQQLAYHTAGEQADRLRAATLERAKALGVDASGLKNPVLVRVVPPEHQGKAGELSRVLNEPLTGGRTPTADAVSRGRKISPATASLVSSLIGDGSLRDALNDRGQAERVLRALVEDGAFSEKDLTGLVDDRGIPTTSGKEVIENALLGSVLPDVRTLSETPPSIRKTLLRALPSLVYLKTEWPEFADHMVNLLGAAKFVRDTKLALEDALRQATIIPEPWQEDEVAVRMAGSLIYETPTKFAQRLSGLARDMRDVKAGQADLYLAPEERTPEGLVRRAFGSVGPQKTRRPKTLGMPDPSQIPDDLASRAAPLSTPALTMTDGDALQRDPELVSFGEPQIFGTLDRTAAAAGVVTKPHISRALRRVLSEAGGEVVPMLVTPGLKRQKALGQFMIRMYLIQLQKYGDIRVMTHEVGHAFAELFFGDTFLKNLARGLKQPIAAAQKELLALGEALYPDKPKLWYAEGWAEFMRTYLSDPGTLSQVAPRTAEWFDQTVLPNTPRVAKAIETARELITHYRLQGSLARAQAGQIRVGKLQRAWETTLEFWRAKRLFSLFWSAQAPIDQIIRDASRIEKGRAALKGKQKDPEVLARLAALDPEQNPMLPSNLARGLRAIAGPTVLHMVEEEMVDAAGVPVGPSLNDAMQRLSRKGMAVFSNYLHAQRTRAEFGDFAPVDFTTGEPVQTKNRDTGMTPEDARHNVEQWEAESPELSEVAELYYQWILGVQNYVAQVSENGREAIRRVRANNMKMTGMEHGYYTPLNRVFEQEETDWYGWLKRGRTQSRTPGIIKRYRGSGRPIKPTVESAIANAVLMISSAQKNAVFEAVAKLADQYTGLAKYLHEIKPEDEPAAVENLVSVLANMQRALEQVRPEQSRDLLQVHEDLTHAGEIRGLEKESRKAGKAGRGDVVAQIERRIEELANEAEDVLALQMTFWAPPASVKGGWYVISRWDPYARRVRHWRMNRGIYEALASIDPYKLPMLADAILRVPRDLFRLGATGMRASFGLITNMMVDLPTVMIQTRSTRSGMFLFFNYWRSFTETMLAAATGGKFQSEGVKMFARMGLEGSRLADEDVRWVERSQNAMLAGRRVWTIPPQQLPRFAWTLVNKGYHYVRGIIGAFESAGRLAEGRTFGGQKMPGWEPGMKMSFGQSISQRVAMKQVSADFSEGGTVTRFINQIVPFFGASIAGPREFMRAMHRAPARTLARGLVLTGAAIAYWYSRRDEEWFKDATDEEKFLYAMFPIGDAPDDPVVRWRVPHEPGYLFFSMPLMFLDAWYRDDPKTAGEWASTFLDGAGATSKNMLKYAVPDISNVPLLSTALGEVVNYDFNRGRQIIPDSESMNQVPPEQQIGPYTTRAATLTAEWAAKRGVYLSPRRIDHIIRGLTAGAAMDVLKAVGLGPGAGRTEEIEIKAEDRFVVGQLFRAGGKTGVRSRDLDQFFDSYRRLELLRQRGTLTKEDERLWGSVEDARQAITHLGFLRAWAKDRDEQAAYFQAIKEMASKANEDIAAGKATHRADFIRASREADRKRDRRKRELERDKER